MAPNSLSDITPQIISRMLRMHQINLHMWTSTQYSPFSFHSLSLSLSPPPPPPPTPSPSPSHTGLRRQLQTRAWPPGLMRLGINMSWNSESPPPPLQTQHYVYLHNALLTTSQHIPHHLTMHPSPPHNASLTTSQCTVHMHLPTQSIAKHTMYYYLYYTVQSHNEFP